MERKIPKVFQHDLVSFPMGFSRNINQKEYCDCDDCIGLRIRRDSIYNKWYHKIIRWCNNK